MSLIESARQYVHDRIAPEFHDKRIVKLRQLKLAQILKRKNPYLFRAKAIVAAPDLVKHLLLAYLSSQEETIFGDFLEGLAIHVCSNAYGGQKSTTEGVDLEFVRDGVRSMPEPSIDAIFDNVYAEPHPLMEEQRRTLHAYEASFADGAGA